MRLVPQTLAGQLTALLLAALVASQAIAFWIHTSDRAEAVRQADRSGLLETTASVLRMLRLAAPAERAELAAAASSPRVQIWITPDSVVPTPPGLRPRVPAQFNRLIGPLPDTARVEIIREGQPNRPLALQDVRRLLPLIPDRYDVLVSVPFPDVGWLNARTQIMAEPVGWPWASTVSAVVMAVAILLIIAFTARRATRPLRMLAARADALGRGTPEPPMPEAGPDEVRRVTTAFNRMQDRLGRFVADRTRMIAAIGHDLRTPITSLKLRTELLDDEEAKAKMMATLEDMQRMIEATLAFARDEAQSEAPRSVDLAALISTVVDDQSDIGRDVSFAEAARLPYRCRPTALKRAIVNLITNAVQYGDRARVTLSTADGGPVIVIDDDGPGIPPDRIDDAFQPFVRLESSRNRATGGVGLGLSIARSIVLAHGGQLTLANRPEGGLRAEIRLPHAEGTAAS